MHQNIYSSDVSILLHVSARNRGVLSVANSMLSTPTYFAMDHFGGAAIAVPVHPRACHRGLWGL